MTHLTLGYIFLSLFNIYIYNMKNYLVAGEKNSISFLSAAKTIIAEQLDIFT
jgi:hypothetical protein